jgi:Tfp pilus assembly protein PilV
MRNESGQMLVEVLVALSLFVIIITAVIIFFFNGQLATLSAGRNREALGIARNGIEAVRFIRDTDWINMLNGQYGLEFTEGQWRFNGTSDTTGDYTRVISITTPETNIRQIISRVSWQDDRFGQQEIEIATLLSDWQNAPPPSPPGGDPGDPGGSGIIGDWANPRTLGSINLGPGNSATDVDVLNKIVFLSTEASTPAKPDLHIVDATDGEHPIVIADLNTGDGLNAIDVSGDYVYVANNDKDVSHLQVIDVSNINDPSMISQFWFTDAGEAVTVFYSDDKVYVGTKKSGGGKEFHIVDVTDPYHLSLVGDLEIGEDVNGIFVKEDKAYLATSDSDELIIVDIIDPADLSIHSTFGVPGNSEDGKTVYIVGDKLYLGRLIGGKHTNHHEFHILDITDTLNPSNLGSVDLATSLNDIVVRSNLAFLATSLPNSEFQIWDISDPAAPSLFTTFNFPQVATGIDFEDNLVYVSVRSNDALRIITSGP